MIENEYSLISPDTSFSYTNLYTSKHKRTYFENINGRNCESIFPIHFSSIQFDLIFYDFFIFPQKMIGDLFNFN